MHTTIQISPSVTPEQRRDPRFIALLRDSEQFFNCRKNCCFSDKFRRLLCLHEAGHIVYARRLGVEPVFYGPMMMWDTRPEYDRPAISKSSVEFDNPVNATLTAMLKANIAGFVFREQVSDSPNDEIAIGVDMQAARQCYAAYGGRTEEGFQRAVAEARQEIVDELRSLEFQKLVWETAKEFGQTVFPAPKLTSSGLKARRLSWAQI